LSAADKQTEKQTGRQGRRITKNGSCMYDTKNTLLAIDTMNNCSAGIFTSLCFRSCFYYLSLCFICIL